MRLNPIVQIKCIYDVLQFQEGIDPMVGIMEDGEPSVHKYWYYMH